ncbi:MAG: helix-turn-helix domain-containing protein [Flavobacteriaceae bacterium]|nr:helix-turn-helix domain-containing protein [Flavobacteriaceae bacterium]
MKGLDIRDVRKELGKTQAEFAELVNVSKNSVQLWETGKRNPSPNTVLLIQSLKEKHTKLVNKEVDSELLIQVQEVADFIVLNEGLMKNNKTFKLFLDREIERAENKVLKEFLKK